MGSKHGVEKPMEHRDDFSIVARKIGNIYHI